MVESAGTDTRGRGEGRRAGVKVRRRIEAACGWEAERNREALPDGLEEIQEAGLGGLPSGVWRPIQDHFAPKDQARLAAVSGYINNALGGAEGAWFRKEATRET